MNKFRIFGFVTLGIEVSVIALLTTSYSLGWNIIFPLTLISISSLLFFGYLPTRNKTTIAKLNILLLSIAQFLLVVSLTTWAIVVKRYEFLSLITPIILMFVYYILINKFEFSKIIFDKNAKRLIVIFIFALISICGLIIAWQFSNEKTTMLIAFAIISLSNMFHYERSSSLFSAKYDSEYNCFSNKMEVE